MNIVDGEYIECDSEEVYDQICVLGIGVMFEY